MAGRLPDPCLPIVGGNGGFGLGRDSGTPLVGLSERRGGEDDEDGKLRGEVEDLRCIWVVACGAVELVDLLMSWRVGRLLVVRP